MTIDALEPVRLADMTQWIRVRGRDEANPVLLLMQLGPGLPMINEMHRFEQELRLEEAFTVVYWDQRGTGLALRDSGVDITPERMVADTVAVLERLRERFGTRPIVSGFSFGATFAAYAATQRPDLFASLVAVGMDIDIPAADISAYDFALRTAHDRGKRRAIRQLEAIGPPPHRDAKAFSTRARWVTNFGGVTTDATYNSMLRTLVASLVRSPDYSPADVLRTLRGIGTTQAALVPQLADTDLVHTVPRLDVPIVMVQGRHDQVAPADPAERFSDSVTAPTKEFVWFDRSAHTPHLEEPAKFRDVLMKVRSNDAWRVV